MPDPVTITVRVHVDGALVVSSPGTPRTRIVAAREKLARAAGQRVAELVEEALAARERREG
ncbi:hypothetical protein BK022_08485 [Methylorubrum extorquens]|uniref:Uncharacterized protein n=1 Tax=Methylorubrum extorquens TaxID=408 RepID=A0A1S1P6X8_METEX|nr:hypothetical protein BK022_08485 [Methylorubrum extorquens]